MVLQVLLCGCGDGKAPSEVPSETGRDAEAIASEADSGQDSFWYLDADADAYGDAIAEPVRAAHSPMGYVADGWDCDDTNPDIHPGSSEVCNDVDDDCDGEIDDAAVDMRTFHMDVDGDGYGAGDAGTVSCEAIAGSIEDGTDCDDADAAINPGATEFCGDGDDDDCDGEIDELPSDYDDWRYPDVDGDGHGNDDLVVAACKGPFDETYISTGGDCDDGNPMIHEGAAEWCDGLDDDCDGLVDEDDPDVSESWYIDDDGDGYGDDSVYKEASCETPPGGVTLYGDCDDSDAGVSPSAEELCGDTTDEDCDGVASDCTIWGGHGLGELEVAYVGEGAGSAGWTVAAAGDTNVDGMNDMWIGAPSGDGGGSSCGMVYLVQGATEGGSLSERATVQIWGIVDYGSTGAAIANAGDIDIDGYVDVWVGTPMDSEDGVTVGSASLFLGPFWATIALSDAEVRWSGVDEYDFAGYSVAGNADLNSDGLLDALVGANRREYPTSAGSVFLVYQDREVGFRTLDDASVELTGEEDGDHLGRESVMLGDTTGDGVADALLAADLNEEGGIYAGAVYLLSEALDEGIYDVGDVSHRIIGDAYLGLGDGLASIADMNEDGYGDFAVGATGDSTFEDENGAVFIFYGPPTDDMTDVYDAVSRLAGSEKCEYVSPVDGGHDLDADGYLDLVIGGYYNGCGGTLPGMAYLVRGPLEDGTLSLEDSDALFAGEDSGDYAGHSVAMVGDSNGDGYADALIGAPLTGDAEGTAYLVFGSALD